MAAFVWSLCCKTELTLTLIQQQLQCGRLARLETNTIALVHYAPLIHPTFIYTYTIFQRTDACNTTFTQHRFKTRHFDQPIIFEHLTFIPNPAVIIAAFTVVPNNASMVSSSVCWPMTP